MNIKFYIKLLATGLLVLLSTLVSAAEVAECSTDKSSHPSDRYTCCSNMADNAWANDAFDYQGGCPKNLYSGGSCFLNTRVFASDPENISLKQDCTNHGYPYIKLK